LGQCRDIPVSSRLAPSWGIVLYLILADLQNTVLSAWLVFAERLIYPSYRAAGHPWGISALDDQAAAGAIMWVPGSIAFLLPIAGIVGQMLSPTLDGGEARQSSVTQGKGGVW
jgi:cytochrome c oxidase assembly factor CtaG